MNSSNILKKINNNIRSLNAFSRFLIVGGINFGLTYLTYLFFILFFSYSISYTIAYCSGILLSYLLNKQFVFKATFKKKQLFLFPTIYLIQYIIGLLVSMIWVEYFMLSQILIPMITTLINIPVTYILMKLLFINGS